MLSPAHPPHHVERLCAHIAVYVYDGRDAAEVGLMLYCPACGPVPSDTPDALR